jgi:hypothetical protein
VGYCNLSENNVKAILYFLKVKHDRVLPTWGFDLDRAFLRIKDKYPCLLADFDFVPNPVLLHSEDLAAILERLNMYGYLEEAPLGGLQLSVGGLRVIRDDVLPGVEEEPCRGAADLLADYIASYEETRIEVCA